MSCQHVLQREIIPIPNSNEILVHFKCKIELCTFSTRYQRRKLEVPETYASHYNKYRGGKRFFRLTACCFFCGHSLNGRAQINKHTCIQLREHIDRKKTD